MEAKPQQITKLRTHVSAQLGGPSLLDIQQRIYNAVDSTKRNFDSFEQMVFESIKPENQDRKLTDIIIREIQELPQFKEQAQVARAIKEAVEEVKTQQVRKIVAVKNHEFSWRCTAISCLIEYLAYQADSEVRKVLDALSVNEKETIDNERKDALNYVDKYVECVCQAIDQSEDFMCGFRTKLSKTFKRKLTSACNAVTKQTKSLGVEKYIDAVSHLALTMKFIEIQLQCYKMISQSEWYSYVRKNTPVERGIPFAELAYKHYAHLLETLDPDEHKKPGQNKNIDKLFNDLITMLMDTKLYVSAVNYALKENKQ